MSHSARPNVHVNRIIALLLNFNRRQDSRPRELLPFPIGYFVSILGPKHLELLSELLTAVNTTALLGNPGNPNFQPDAADIRAGADAQATDCCSYRKRDRRGICAMAQDRVCALVVMADPF